MLKSNLILLFAFIFILYSCGKKSEVSNKENKEKYIVSDNNTKAGDSLSIEDNGATDKKTTTEFKKELTKAFDSYLVISSSLFASDANEVKSAAGNFNAIVKKINTDGLDDASKSKWNSYLSNINTLSNQIQNSSDIEAQRKSFYDLSETLGKAIKRFGIEEKSVYRIYCPMAFDDKGAYWLNDAKEVKNPYFGTKMPKCGDVKEQLTNNK